MFRTRDSLLVFIVSLILAIPAMADVPPDPCCASCDGTNTAVSFEGGWAFRASDGIHVCWVSAPEIDSKYYEVYRGNSRDELLSIVSAVGGASPHFYEIVVSRGAVFEVVEVDDNESTLFSTRPFRLSARPPENIALLRSMNPEFEDWKRPDVSIATGNSSRAWRSAATVTVTDYVFYSSRSDFLTAVQPVRNIYSSMNRSSQTILGSNDPNECRSVMQAIYQEAINQGYPRLPFLIIVGNAYEDTGDPRNIVGTFYYPDDEGNCYFGDCASDVQMVDFDGDDLPDVPWSRILGDNLTDIEHSVQAAVYYYNGQRIRPERAVVFDGDLNAACVPVLEPRATLEQIVSLYQGKGVPTEVRHESEDYSSCVAYDEKLADVVSIFQVGVTEILGTGNITNRSKLPGWIIQKVYDPVFTMSAVPYPQVFVAEFPGCELGGEDRLNPSYYPSIMQMFMTADPDVYPTAVAWFGHRRGGFETAHLEFARRYFENRIDVVDDETTLHDVYFDTIRDLGAEQSGLKTHLLLCGAFGWPVQLPDMIPDPPPPGGSKKRPRIEMSGEVGIATRLEQNFPNPFNPSTTIRYSVSRLAPVDLVIYDVLGRRVRTLVSEQVHERGRFERQWHGRDDLGNKVASGVYFCRLRVGNEVFQRKLVLMK